MWHRSGGCRCEVGAVWWGGLAGGAGSSWRGKDVSDRNVTLVATLVGRAQGGRVGASSEGAPMGSAARGLKAPWGAVMGGSDRAQSEGSVVKSRNLDRVGFGMHLWVWYVLTLTLSTALTLRIS